MDLQILLAGVEFGPYTEDQARQLLDDGFLSATDPAKRLDETHWLPLSSVLGVTAPSAVGSSPAPALEFKSIATALDDDEEEFHAPLPPDSEVAQEPLEPPAYEEPSPSEREEEGAPPILAEMSVSEEEEEPRQEPEPVEELEPPPPAPSLLVPPSSRPALTPPGAVSAARVTRAIGVPPPPAEHIPFFESARPPSANTPAEGESEPKVPRPPPATEEIKSSFAAALAKTRSLATGDTAPLPATPRTPPAPAASGAFASAAPASSSGTSTTPSQAARSAVAPAASAPPVANAPARPPNITSSVRAATFAAMTTAPLTSGALPTRTRKTVTGSLLAKEALIKARESAGSLAPRTTTALTPAPDFQPEPPLPRRRAPVQIGGQSASPGEATSPRRKSIRLTGRITLPGAETKAASSLESAEPKPTVTPDAEAKTSAALEPAAVPPPVQRPAAPAPSLKVPPVAAPKEREAPRGTPSRKAIRLTGPISLPGHATQPTRPGLFSNALDTAPLTGLLKRPESRTLTPALRTPAEDKGPIEPPIEPPATPLTVVVPPPIEKPTGKVEPAEIPEDTLPDAKAESDLTASGQLNSSGSLKITGPLRQPPAPRPPVRLSSPSGDSGLLAPPGDLSSSSPTASKPAAPISEEELASRAPSGKIPIHEFPTEGVRVRTRRVTTRIPLPVSPGEAITSESPARKLPPPLPSKSVENLSQPRHSAEAVPATQSSAEPDYVAPDPTSNPALTAEATPSPVAEAKLPPPVAEPLAAPELKPLSPAADQSEIPKPEKTRLRRPVKLELTSRKVQDSGRLTLEAFSKIASQELAGAPAADATKVDSPSAGAPEAAAATAETVRKGDFSAPRLKEAPPLTWGGGKKKAFPMEWVFYGIILLGFLAMCLIVYLAVHRMHGAAPSPARQTEQPSPATSAPAPSTIPASASPPSTAAPPATVAPPAIPPAVTQTPSPTPARPPVAPTPTAAQQATLQQADAFVSDGILKYQHSDFEGAIGAYNKALELNPKSAQAYFNRGIAKAAHDDLDGAVADYSQALQADPNMAEAYYYRGLARHSKGELDGAVSDYNNAVRINPKNALAFFNRGLIRMQKDDIDGAVVDSTSALELDPHLIQSYYDRGLGRLAKGAMDAALADMKTFTQLAPQDAYTDYARLYIWLIETQQGQLAEANKELGAAMNSGWNGASDSMVTRIGEYLLGQISESDLIKASASPLPLKDQGQRCEAWYFVGMRKLEAGDKDAAADALRKCIDTQKTDYCEYILAGEALKALQPAATSAPAAQPPPAPVPRIPSTSGLPDPGTMSPAPH